MRKTPKPRKRNRRVPRGTTRNTVKPSGPVATAVLKSRFLESYAELGNIKAAAKAASVGRRSHYEWLKADEAYAANFAEAQAEAIDTLEREARRRAVEGVLEPVYQVGEKVGTIRKFSDTLLIFLLKGAKPDVYRERFEHSGGLALKPVATLSDAELDAELLKYAAMAKGEAKP